MRNVTRVLVLSFACTALVAGASSLFAGSPAPLAVPSLHDGWFSPDAKDCASHPGTYMCKVKDGAAGRVNCFGSLCDAQAAGAYACKKFDGACEPL